MKSEYERWLENELEAERKRGWALRQAVYRFNALYTGEQPKYLDESEKRIFVMQQANDILRELKEAENERSKDSDTDPVS